MSVSKILSRLDSTLATWRSRLDPLDEETLQRKPADGGWCVAEICGHIGSVSAMLLDHAEKCAHGDGEQKGFQFKPALICLVGSLPPMRIKVPIKQLPPELHHFASPESPAKAQALEALDGVAERMHAMRATVEAASTRCRRRHPVGGWLHSRQWFHMTEMHMRHHLRQLDRTLS